MQILPTVSWNVDIRSDEKSRIPLSPDYGDVFIREKEQRKIGLSILISVYHFRSKCYVSIVRHVIAIGT